MLMNFIEQAQPEVVGTQLPKYTRILNVLIKHKQQSKGRRIVLTKTFRLKEENFSRYSFIVVLLAKLYVCLTFYSFNRIWFIDR